MSTGYIRGNIKERIMEIISTTATAAEKLKRLAKTLRKTTGTSLAVALDNIAKQHGYMHWKHVTACLEQTAGLSRTKPLPESLQDLLDGAARNPASADSQTTNEMMELTKRAQSALTDVYKPDGLNLGMNLGRAAGAGVAGHYHMHLLPRWVGDVNFMTAIGQTRTLPETLQSTYQKLLGRI